VTSPPPPSSPRPVRSAHDPAAVPGERPPARLPTAEGSAPKLERAPGERYRPTAGTGSSARRPAAATPDPSARAAATSGRARAATIIVAIAVAGGLILTILELLDLGAGLLAVGAAIGWACGLAVRATTGPGTDLRIGPTQRSITAASAAVFGASLGFVLIWAWSRTEGGVLGPIDYLGDRFGVLPLLLLVLAAGAAAIRAR
jgi:hypothetical protein